MRTTSVSILPSSKKQFSEWKMLYISFLTRIIVTHLRSSDLTEYPDPDSPEPCLGSVYIWRPFIPPHNNARLKIFAFLLS